MSTPIERGAEALMSQWSDDIGSGVRMWTDPRNVSSAVFASIDRDELADMMPLGYEDRDKYHNTFEAADAIIAWLTGTDA